MTNHAKPLTDEELADRTQAASDLFGLQDNTVGTAAEAADLLAHGNGSGYAEIQIKQER